MERLICNKKTGNTLIIEGSEFKHLKALRLKKGQKLEVYCEGKIFLASISELSKNYALCSILEEIDTLLPRPQIILYQCLPVDISLMDEVIDRSSQAGVIRLVPLLCKRGFHGRLNWEEKLKRWERLSLASFKQCKRPSPMEISTPIKITDLYPKEDVSIVLDNFEGSLSIRDISLDKDSYGIVVGPEGGFSREEIELLKNRGFLTLLLKPYVYRSEMAGAVAAALIINLYQ